MKNKFYGIIMMFVMMLGTAIAFSSCSKNDDDEKSVVGTWYSTYMDDYYKEEYTLTINANNTATMVMTETNMRTGRKDTDVENFTYSINGNIVTIVETGDDDVMAATFTVTGNQLIIIPIGDEEDMMIFTRK